ncbi:MAG: thiamine-phosphate kinase, partial [Calditrichaeota bacterium]
LVQHFAVHAMIDISDGLAPEVGHICRQSGTGATILANRIPLDQATRRVARQLGDDPIHYALQGGEDFELLFAAPAEAEAELERSCSKEFDLPCTRIGLVTEKGRGVQLEDAAGGQTPLVLEGYDHFKK